jgi:hypothetical protein
MAGRLRLGRFETLAGLVAAARAAADSGADQMDVIDAVAAAVLPFGIRVHHDSHPAHSLPETPAPEAAAAPAAAPEAVAAPPRRRGRKTFVELPVHTVRQRDGSHTLALGAIFAEPDVAAAPEPPAEMWRVARLVLCVDKAAQRGAGRASQIHYECNGVVLDARTWRILSMPPGAFNHSPTAKTVDAYLARGLYDVIRADDGTVVTLYGWTDPRGETAWAMSTSGAYDVSTLRWLGEKTYAEIFCDLVERLYPAFKDAAGMSLTETGTLAFSKLDAGRCYTVGFRHWDFHPLRADPERMWQIQACESGMHFVPPRMPGALPVIPGQTVESAEALAAKQIPATLAGLRDDGRDALAAAANYISVNPAGVPATSPTHGYILKPPSILNYGFILRSRDPNVTGIHSDILVETPLLARIRKLAYERAPRADRDALAPSEGFAYNAWRALLTPGQRETFLSLYPEWKERFTVYSDFLSNVVEAIIHAIRLRAMAPATREPALKTATGRVAAALLEHISRCESVSAFHKDLESVVRDYVADPQYALLFMRACK